MKISATQLILRAKQREILELKRLNNRVRLAGILGHMVHVLQSERGASSIYLASSGKRFNITRNKLIEESEAVTTLLLEEIEQELDNSSFYSSKIVSLMAWAILGLEAMPELRTSITRHNISGFESVAAFSRMISGLIALIFELADAGVDPEISRLLVSLFYLIDGKEMAGQERANGALAFAAGTCDTQLQQRILHLIDAQQRSLRIFLEFSDKSLSEQWRKLENTTCIEQLEQMRELIRHTDAQTSLDSDISDSWFNCCSERISDMWGIQRQLVVTLQQRCQTLIDNAQQELQDSRGLLKTLPAEHSASKGVIDRFFDPELPVERLMVFRQSGADNIQQAPESVIGLLQQQSRHLADIETKLESAQRALNERKIIERAKGLLMEQFQLNEDQAYKHLRNQSMEQNRRLAEVAESLLSHSEHSSGGDTAD